MKNNKEKIIVWIKLLVEVMLIINKNRILILMRYKMDI